MVILLSWLRQLWQGSTARHRRGNVMGGSDGYTQRSDEISPPALTSGSIAYIIPRGPSLWSLRDAQTTPSKLLVNTMIGTVQLLQQVPGPVNEIQHYPTSSMRTINCSNQGTSLLLCQRHWEGAKKPKKTLSTFHATTLSV